MIPGLFFSSAEIHDVSHEAHILATGCHFPVAGQLRLKYLSCCLARDELLSLRTRDIFTLPASKGAKCPCSWSSRLLIQSLQSSLHSFTFKLEVTHGMSNSQVAKKNASRLHEAWGSAVRWGAQPTKNAMLDVYPSFFVSPMTSCGPLCAVCVCRLLSHALTSGGGGGVSYSQSS